MPNDVLQEMYSTDIYSFLQIVEGFEGIESTSVDAYKNQVNRSMQPVIKEINNLINTIQMLYKKSESELDRLPNELKNIIKSRHDLFML